MHLPSFVSINRLFLSSLIIAAPATAANGIDMLTEDDLLVEIPIVSNVTHMQQTLAQTPAAVTIIDRQTIQASTAVDITDLFRLVPGFQTYYVNGSRRGVTYHALGDKYPRRLEVKVDGRSVYESLFSAVTWSTIGVELDEIDHIEIVRGANAAADGSNAFLASINIVTRSPLLDSGLSFRAQVGSAQTRNAAISYSGKVGVVDHRTTLSVRGNDGFDDGTFRGQPLAITDDIESVSFATKGLWTPSANNNIEFQLGATKSDLWVGGRDYVNRDMSYQYQYVNWNRLSEKGNKIQLIGYHNNLDFEDAVIPQKISEVLGVDDTSPFWPLPVPDKTIFDGDNRSQSERWDLELRTSLKLADKLRAVTGAAVRNDTVTSQTFFDTPDDISETSYRAYTNLEWTQSAKLVFNGGVIVEDRESTGTYASYRLAENYLFNNDHVFRVAINRSFRAPTLLENNQMRLVRYNQDLILDATVISDLDIENEELQSYEIGYAGYFINRELSLDMRLYYEQLRNIIDERRDQYPDLDNFVNIRDNTDTQDIKGIEIQAVYIPSDQFLLRGFYSHSNISGTNCHTSAPAVGEPCSRYRNLAKYSLNNTLGLMASYTFDGGLRLSSTVNHNSALEHFRADNVESFTRIDLKAAKTWDFNRSSVDLSLTVQNAGDPYQEYYQFNLFKTRYILGFKMNFY